MTTTAPNRFQDLQQRFLVGLERRVSDLFTTLSSTSDPESLRHMFHSLVGIGGTYGFPRITEISRSCEALCVAGMKEQRKITKDEREQLRSAVEQIRASAIPIAA